MRKKGDFKPIIPRLEKYSYVDSNGCWVWKGAKNLQGYGKISWKGKLHQAHRVSYKIFVGKISSGLHIDHLCRNPPCINPKHLEPVTIKENVARGEKGRMVKFCAQGHEYTPENTYIAPDNGTRKCKTCRKERSNSQDKRLYNREYMRKKREN